MQQLEVLVTLTSVVSSFLIFFPFLSFSSSLSFSLLPLPLSPSLPPQDLVGREDNDVVIHVIDKDLARTFPSHVLFAEKGSQGYVPFPFTHDKSVISDIHIHCVHVQLQITFMYQARNTCYILIHLIL